MPRPRRLRATARLSTVALTAGGCVVALAAPSFAAPSQFSAGDLVVYQVAGTASSASAVSLVEYTTAGTPSGYSVALPTTDSGITHAVTESGSALNDGELTLSADGQSLVATGYDAAVGTAKITSAAAVPRTVALVSPTGIVDTSTALGDSTAEANNFRSATTAVTGGSIYVGTGGGTGVVTDGATATNYLTSDKVHDVAVVDGDLYESTTKDIFQIGAGLPSGGTQTITALIPSADVPANFGPDQFALVTLGNGPGPNTLYVADGSNGAGGAGPNAVEKYSLESGVWTPTGSVAFPLAAGLTADVVNGVAHVYVTGAGTNNDAANTVLASITDSSGFGGTLSATPVTLATAPSGSSFKGVAFSPAITTPPADLPETPFVPAIAVLGAALFGGYVINRRRHAGA
jgi:hypothetical protein